MADPDALSRPNVLTFPKTVELEHRVARAEGTVAEQAERLATQDAQLKALRETVDVLNKRIVSLQAQLDHLFGKIQPY